MNLHQYYLQQMGIYPWLVRSPGVYEVAPSNRPLDPDFVMNWDPTHSNKQLMIIVEGLDVREELHAGGALAASRRLLNKMLASVGLYEKDVCMIHCLKMEDEDVRERLYDAIIQQIKWVDPKVILLLGSSMGNFFLKLDQSLDDMRIHQYRYETIPVLVSYHPEALLEKPANKRNAYQDWVALNQIMTGE